MSKDNLKRVFAIFILLIVIISIIINYMQNIEINIKIDCFTIITFIINGIVIIIGCIKDKKSYSLNKIFWYFSFFFLFFAPLFQYLSGYALWGYQLNNDDYINTNLLLFIWFVLYSVFYKLKTKEKKYKHKIEFTKHNLNIGLIISLLLLIVTIKLIGFQNLFVRNENGISTDIGFVNVILNNAIKIIPAFFFIYSIYYYRNKGKNIKLYIIFFGIITVMLNYPSSITRYWIGAVYIGIAVVIFNKYIKYKRFDLVLIIIFLVIFPLFQMFKWYTVEDFFNKNVKMAGVYNNVDFDAYSMFARTITYVNDNSSTYGGQLLGTIFFFIPRNIWPNKPVPSGELVSSAQGQEFTNLSCPLPAEGYINFGILGIIIYAILTGRILRKLDDNYWKDRENVTYIDLTYPFALGLLIFLLRGAFHPVAVYMFTLYLPIIILILFNIMKKIIKN